MIFSVSLENIRDPILITIQVKIVLENWSQDSMIMYFRVLNRAQATRSSQFSISPVRHSWGRYETSCISSFLKWQFLSEITKPEHSSSYCQNIPVDSSIDLSFTFLGWSGIILIDDILPFCEKSGMYSQSSSIQRSSFKTDSLWDMTKCLNFSSQPSQVTQSSL